MAKRRVDYDRVAPDYDKRYTPGSRGGTAEALTRLAQRLNADRALEAGCGTGHWLALLHQVVPRLYGLDASTGMLLQAQSRKLPMELAHGVARQLPFKSNSFDLVFCVNAIHHFDDPQTFISEAARVLRPGGALAVVGSDPRGRRESWYVYRFFAGTYETDLGRFPARETVSEWMLASGFDSVELKQVERFVEPRRGREVFKDPFLQKNACSQLALLTDQAYAAGLRRIEVALAQAETRGETIVFQTDISLAMLTGHKL